MRRFLFSIWSLVMGLVVVSFVFGCSPSREGLRDEDALVGLWKRVVSGPRGILTMFFLP